MPAPLERLLHPVDICPVQSAPPPHPHHEDQSADALTAAIAPYKRVPKACTQCRRDKTRCDKGRPCHGCIKRGRAHLCLDGCVTCRRGRLRCDGNRPCGTCAEHGRDCVEDHPAAIAAARSRQSQAQRQKPLAVSTTSAVHPPTSDSADSTDTPSLPPCPSPTSTPKTRSRAPHGRSSDSRVKGACLVCRRDNKKCPGGRPCPRCAYGDEDCVYLARAPKLVKQRCALCRKKNKKCEEARPCVHCIKEGIDCVDLPRKGTGPGLRVKRACAGCRADKIQCEEERPCAGCKRKKIPCVPRECKACFEKGEKCSACVRRGRFHRDQSPSEESDSDWDGLSTPSLYSSASSTLVLDPRLVDKPSPPLLPPMHHDYAYPPSRVHEPALYAPLPGPSFSAPGAPPGPFVHAIRPYPFTYVPDNSLLLCAESPRLLSLSASLSDIRTRPQHLADE